MKNKTEILSLFRQHYNNNEIYRCWCEAVGVDNISKVELIDKIEHIPFLPIELFKTNKVYCSQNEPVTWFESSGTSSSDTSKHYVGSIEIYEQSYLDGFRKFYGDPSIWSIFALLPMYLERPNSSLAMMVEGLHGYNPTKGGYYLNDFEKLKTDLKIAIKNGEKIFLIGVTFALLEFAKNHKIELGEGNVVMETGGMKGRGKEIERNELHKILGSAFGVGAIHSEYGMTELLSQAYSKGGGIFECSDSMIVVGRELDNPLSIVKHGKNLGINIIDLSNVDSCPFIATGDRGNIYPDGSFEILGRIEGEILRGCNMLA